MFISSHFTFLFVKNFVVNKILFVYFEKADVALFCSSLQNDRYVMSRALSYNYDELTARRVCCLLTARHQADPDVTA